MEIFLILISQILFLISIFKIPKARNGINEIVISTPRFKKMIYILIDGLRFDAAIPVSKEGLYHNKIPFFHNKDILNTTFLSISGIPTSTTCRVFSMMTGTPSNQIQELMSLYVTNLSIDNLPLKFKDRRIAHYGDEVWPKMFSTLKDKSKSICSYSKADFMRLEKDLMDDILKDENDICFAHIIALDALGHIHGTDKNIIAAELKQINEFLVNVYNKLDDETLMILASDHGVTNEGCHGGVSKEELAAFCGFYCKDKSKLSTINNSNKDRICYNEQFISKFYDTTMINQNDDWIKAHQKYKLVHQDDILPTICYFMGVAPPLNVYGNLIEHLIDDDNAFRLLADLKGKHHSESKKKTSSILEENYLLTLEIYNECTGYYPVICLFSGVAGLISLLLMLWSVKNDISFRVVPYVLISTMTTVSFFCFASEDLLWFLVIFISHPTFSNFLMIFYLLKSSDVYFLNSDRINLGITKFKSLIDIVPIALLYSLAKSLEDSDVLKNFIKIRQSLATFITRPLIIIENGEKYNIFTMQPSKIPIITSFKKNKFLAEIFQKNALHYILTLYDYLFSMSKNDKILCLISHPSIDMLFCLHYNFKIVFGFLLFIRHIDIPKNCFFESVLLSSVSFFINHEKLMQTIDYQIFFKLSDKYLSVANLLGLVSYLIIPRLYIHLLFESHKMTLFLTTYSLLLNFATCWSIKGSLTYLYFFCGRLVWTVMFYSIDLFLMKLLRSTKVRVLLKRILN